MLLRLREDESGLGILCWCSDGWRPVALDDSFVRAFDPDREPLETPEDAIQLDFPENARALLLLPGNWVWSGVEAIPKAARRQSSAVGYMVEERLAEDVEDLHFLCRPISGEQCSIYAVAREKMDALHSQLQRLQWPVVAAVPEYQLLEPLNRDIALWIDGSQAHIWHKAGYGLTVHRQHLQPLLAHLAEAGDSDDEGDEGAGSAESVAPELQLLGAEGGDALVVAELESLFGERLQRTERAAEEELLACARPDRLANLLSGDYQLDDGSDERDWWYKPAIAAVACFVLQLMLYLAAGGYYQWRAGGAESEAQALFGELFPRDRPSADIRRQIDGYLNQAAAGSSSFARQMQLLSGVWSQHKGGELKLESLRFDGNRGEMVLQLQAPNLTDLDTLVGRLSNGEYKAELLAANELEKGVSGRIRLR